MMCAYRWELLFFVAVPVAARMNRDAAREE